MTIEHRPRAARPGEDKRRAHHSYRVKWRLGGGSGPQQSLTLDDERDARRMEAAVREHGYPSATDPFVRSLAIIGARTVEAEAAGKPTPVTLNAAILAYAARADLAANTRRNYQGIATQFPVDGIGGANVHTLAAAELDYALARLDETLAPSTARGTKSVLATILRAHDRADIVPVLGEGARLVEPRYLTRAQVVTLAAAADKHGLGPMVRLVTQAGTRWGETAALEARHVDLDQGVLLVRQQLPSKDAMPTWAPTRLKSRRSRRDVPLAPATVDLLTEVLAARLDTSPAMFSRKVEPQWANAPWWSYTATKRAWGLTLADAGLGKIRFHDLRHTAAKQMLDSGVRLDVVSHVLGHASVAVTAEVYGGIDRASLDAVRAAFA